MNGRRCGVLMALVFAAFGLGPTVAGLAVEAESRVESVTLYRDQALVTRSVRAEVPAGSGELVVGDLPQTVVPDSLFVAAGDEGQVRAVRYRTRAVREEPRQEIRELDGQVKQLQDDLRRNEAMRGYVDERKQYLGKLAQFTAATAQVELTKGVLNAETLQSLTVFISEQRLELTEELLKLEREQRDLAEQINLLQRKRKELTAGSTRTLREAVVFVDRPQAGPVELRLSYLVSNAGWEPTYNLRARDDGAAVTVEYNATVYQMSGEDWQGVELTLSTAFPTLMALGPELAPFWVTLGSPLQARGGRQLGEQLADYERQVATNTERLQRALKVPEQERANWLMIVGASGVQQMEIANPWSDLRRLRGRKPKTEGWSVTYALPGRISLESRSDRQMAQIAGLELPSEFYHVATPLLTNYVYREAEIVNDSELALLAGPATCYLEGRFVGRTQVPMVARGQRFRTGFGLNAQMHTARELVEKSEQTLGGNQQQRYHYRIMLENYSHQPVALRLYDRIPEPTDGADIRVTLGEMSDELSQDRSYVEQERRRGILRWDLEVPAKAAGAEARKVEYHFSLEFDRKFSVISPVQTGEAGEGKEQFQEQMRMRQRAQ